MSRVVKDYNLPTGGSYDVLILDFVEGFPESHLKFRIAKLDQETGRLAGISRRVTGLQKVAQMFLYTLLTSKGSDPLRENWGTVLPDLIRGGNIYSKGYAESVVREAVRDAKEQVVALTTSNQVDAERLSDATLTRVDVGLNSISVGIQLSTDAGEQAVIFAPFPRFDMEINA